MTSTAPDLESYWQALNNVAPTFSIDEQFTAVALYRELAKGRPIAEDRVAAVLKRNPEEARTLVSSRAIRPFLYHDRAGRIAGFGGLAVTPMHHRLSIGERQLWTWCAWDSLFIPQILATEALVESPDPETKDLVRVAVSTHGLASPSPAGAVVSFLAPDSSAFRESATTVMTRFCHYVFLFASRESGERWVDRHPGTFLYSVESAAELARRFNVRNFPAAVGLD